MTTTTTPTASPRLNGTTEEGFTTLYGVPITAMGEDGEYLLALGHPDDRRVLAVLNAYHRGCGLRLTGGSALRALTDHGVNRTFGAAVAAAPSEEYDWYLNPATRDDPHAQPVTWIDQGDLDCEDVAQQEECPTCGRPSRATTYGWGPGRRTGGPLHRCRHCNDRWPATPVYRPVLWKRRKRSHRNEPGGCFACTCADSYRCSPDCTATTPDDITGHPLCTACRSRYTPDVRRALAAAGYGTALPYEDFAEQRDLWLVSRLQLGIPPEEAARAWADRIDRAARRAHNQALHRRTNTRRTQTR
jgi:hypothetical protein